MLVELDRFIEAGDTWYGKAVKTLDDVVLDKVTINTEYVGWLRRYPICEDFDFTEVHMADRGGTVIVTKTYEEMKALLKVPTMAQAS